MDDEPPRRGTARDDATPGGDRVDTPLVAARRQIGVDLNAGDAVAQAPFQRGPTGPVEEVDDITLCVRICVPSKNGTAANGLVLRRRAEIENVADVEILVDTYERPSWTVRRQ